MNVHNEVMDPERTGLGEPQPVQMISPSGERLSPNGYELDTLEITDLMTMYRSMVLLRRFDQEATALQRQGELGLWPPCLGQEAAQVGLARALRPQDFVFPSYREHGVALARGLRPRDLLRIFRGVSHGGWDPAAHNMSTYEIVIGAQTLHATGWAMGRKFQGLTATGDPDQDAVAVACFGDGATSQGDVSEALTFAASFEAPVLFFCQNNHWAISEPTALQTRVPLSRRGEGFGIPGIRVDGNDVLACYAVVREALERIRSGEGPMLIEAETYRMGAHTTADDPTRYRSAEEVERWRQRDPIQRVRTYLETSCGVSREQFDEVETDADEWATTVRRDCLELPDPEPDAFFDHVYAEPHPLVEEERRGYAEYLELLHQGDAR